MVSPTRLDGYASGFFIVCLFTNPSLQEDDDADPPFFWDRKGFSRKLFSFFKTIERFAIYTDTYLVQPPTNERRIKKLMRHMTNRLKTQVDFQVIFICASIYDENSRCDWEGWLEIIWAGKHHSKLLVICEAWNKRGW